MKLPEIDMALVERRRRQNQRERLQFVEDYANWLKKTPNREWSRQQASLLK